MNEILLNENAQYGAFIEANICDAQKIQAAVKAALLAFADWKVRLPEVNLGLTIGFGADFWHTTQHAFQAAELKNFPSYGNHLAPATQRDLLIHIQGQTEDGVVSLASDVLESFGQAIELTDETYGFRRDEHRGFDGFVDGTENPHGDEKILETAQNEFSGSYVLMQRYEHDLKKWDSYSVEQQEQSVGRSKQTDEEFSREVRHTRSHLGRTNIKENGQGLKIVRRSLPFGTASGAKGLAFIAYAATLHNIEAQLQMMFGDADGETDFLLERMSRAVSGAYYFAPSETALRDLF